MQIKLHYVYFYLLFLFFLLPFNLLANDNPFEYRGVKLGMSIDQIANLESVKTRFMPDPRKLECLKGQYIYNIRNEKISLMKETGKKSQLEKYIYMTFNDLLICKQTILKKFKLEGGANLWSDDVKYSFLKNKLYRIEVEYNPLKFKKNNNEIKNSLNNLLKRYQGKDNVEEFGPSNSRISQGKDYDWMSSIYLFNPRSNRNIDVIILADYRQKKIFGIGTSKNFNKITFILLDKNIDASVSRTGEILLRPKIKQLNDNNKKKKIIANQKKKQKDKLKKKYDY